MDPPSSLVCSAPLALAAAGSLQYERLEPPVVPHLRKCRISIRNVAYIFIERITSLPVLMIFDFMFVLSDVMSERALK